MSVQRILKRISLIKQRGVTRSARIILDRFALKVLQRFYGFNHWHADAPISARPYRHTVAEMVNVLRPECVVEVGCGLGAILSLAKARSRHGYDLDAGAISAARLIRSRDIIFTYGDMSDVREPHIDVLILVNWIHDFSPSQLEAWLLPLIPRIRYLLLDAIDYKNPVGYRFAHDFAFLNGVAKPVSSRRPDGEGRQFILYQVGQ
jgi:SAM-dependent methyltransferase